MQVTTKPFNQGIDTDGNIDHVEVMSQGRDGINNGKNGDPDLLGVRNDSSRVIQCAIDSRKKLNGAPKDIVI